MAVSKKTRFEVFKRDSFTCQYCGKSAPDVILEADHIHPKSKGGEDDILNLVTSCRECNSGKRDRLLSDDTVVKKRRRQLEELQERREQLEMLMEWHKSLMDFEAETIEQLSNFWSEVVPGYKLNENGQGSLKKWLKRFSVNEVIEAMKISAEQYLKYDDSSDDPSLPTKESVEKTFKFVPKICANKRRFDDKPYLKELFYIRGILRNRLHYVNEQQAIKMMEEAVLTGIEVEDIKQFAKEVRNWSSFRDTIEFWIAERNEDSDKESVEG